MREAVRFQDPDETPALHIQGEHELTQGLRSSCNEGEGFGGDFSVVHVVLRVVGCPARGQDQSKEVVDVRNGALQDWRSASEEA